MKKFLVTTAALAAFASPAVALEYVCDVRGNGEGFVSSVVALQFEPGAGTAMVYDAVIDAVHGEPIEVDLKDRGRGRYRMTYRVSNIPARPRPLTILYTINLDAEKNTVVIRGTMPGYSNLVGGKGTCKKR
ncbi:hypothetical protein [Roseobacter sp. OBYS 0001]|uniref:hypothetical protein n=1 Tax=Roseobacter sp. OBYS 0001 TaxID=882651 RepID=UPI001BBA391A|nr:hypothetical protein [Roseobacter sp. OBYS 0001]GIT86914.1 hypothetical protein ROBYS_19300 [Roseobacter sp. OBYS 0001]